MSNSGINDDDMASERSAYLDRMRASEVCGISKVETRDLLLAWAKSEGFATVHNGQATDEQIVDDLLRWLTKRELIIIARKFVYLGDEPMDIKRLW